MRVAPRPTPALPRWRGVGARLLGLCVGLCVGLTALGVEAGGQPMAPGKGEIHDGAGASASPMTAMNPLQATDPAASHPTTATNETTASPTTRAASALVTPAAPVAPRPGAPTGATPAKSALVSTGFPWGRMLLAGLCGLLAVQERDSSARIGWTTLGLGLGAWGSYDAWWRPVAVPSPAPERGASVSWAF